MSFPVNFLFISGEISAENFFWKIFIAPKDSSLNFRGSLFSYFLAIVLISAVISILDDFGSLLPARTVTVRLTQFKLMFTPSSPHQTLSSSHFKSSSMQLVYLFVEKNVVLNFVTFLKEIFSMGYSLATLLSFLLYSWLNCTERVVQWLLNIYNKLIADYYWD